MNITWVMTNQSEQSEETQPEPESHLLSDDEAAMAIITAGFAGEAQVLVAKLKKAGVGFCKTGGVK